MHKPLPYYPDELLVKFLLGEADSSEAEAASNWIASSAEHEAYFHQLRRTWFNVGNPSDFKEADADAAWKRFQKMVGKNPTEARPSTVPAPATLPFFKQTWLRIAAIVIVSVSLPALAYFALQQFSAAPQIEIAAANSTKQVQMPDGTEITLNKKSSLRYPDKFSGRERTVQLEGEGYFAVTPDKTKAFIVEVNGLKVKVVGTSFNIRAYEGKTEVIVETGIVQVIGNGRTVELHPKEKLSVGKAGTMGEKEAATDRLYKYYRTKNFTCDNTPLWKLVETLNEAYNVRIEIVNQDLRNLPLTTVFEEDSLDHILEIIAETFKIKVEKSDDRIILK